MNINIENFRIELAKNCLTLSKLSELSGVNTVTLTRINKGLQEPQPITVGKIAKALNVPVESIIKE